MFGLSHLETEPMAADLDFASRLAATGLLGVWQGGTPVANGPTYHEGAVRKVALQTNPTSGTISAIYYQNGAAFYTTSITPSYPLRLGSPWATLGGKSPMPRL